ncbi:MAG: hypothetical protein ONB48_17505 [candidate division KSB1 bacterium]|nr:hypothetical protein [candidate division KSB1 bacterium]MDZ7275277.1 hypothetical protein [candidate division KSB1 bacterium]MDZ7287445.1 hypothetical protein [candidate division KSB1 bacterium]MDZ7299559.1 hypothetical protein [candidate division KSB1 bacterium]MDZ7308017.1 hypothetical protein [candidate division KSB1 bacterium]
MQPYGSGQAENMNRSETDDEKFYTLAGAGWLFAGLALAQRNDAARSASSAGKIKVNGLNKYYRGVAGRADRGRVQ